MLLLSEINFYIHSFILAMFTKSYTYTRACSFECRAAVAERTATKESD